MNFAEFVCVCNTYTKWKYQKISYLNFYKGKMVL